MRSPHTTSDPVKRLLEAMGDKWQPEDAADIMRVRPEEMDGWLSGEVEPAAHIRSRLIGLALVIEHLPPSIDRQKTLEWMHTRIPWLAGRQPSMLIRQGCYREVLAMLMAIEEGVFV